MADRIDPFYLVVDETVPTTGQSVGSVNGAVSSLFKQGTPPAAGANDFFEGLRGYAPFPPRVTLSLIGFSDTARLVMPMAPVRGARRVPPRFAAKTSVGSFYDAAFDLLRDTIAADFAKLSDEEAEVSPPTVFFLSGNVPADDWQPAYRRLVNSELPPRITAFGYGDAGKVTIQRVATEGAFMSDSSLPQSEALVSAVMAFATMMRSAGGRSRPSPPETVAGFSSWPVLPLPRSRPRLLGVPAAQVFPGPPAIGRRPTTEPAAPLLLPDGWHKATEMALDGADTDALSVRAASLRGADHRDKGVSRQDAFGLYQLRRSGTEAVLGVVADGADDAPLSHLGAAAACRLLADEAQRRLPDLFAAPSVPDLAVVFEDLVTAVADRLVGLAASLRVAPGALSATLAAAVAETAGQPGQRRCFYLSTGDCAAHQLQAELIHPSYPLRLNPGAEAPLASAVLPMTQAIVGQFELTPGSTLILATSGLTKLLRDQKTRDRVAAWWQTATPPSLQEFAWRLSFQHADPGSQAADRTAVGFWVR